MKFRVMGLMLAAMVIVSVTLSAFAATYSVETPMQEQQPVASAPEVEVEAEEPSAPFYLDGVAMDLLVYEVRNNMNYITVESFVASLDREAMVEEEDGTVVVNAVAVTEVVDVAAGETTRSGVEQANLEEEGLNLAARIGDTYAVANNRYLYVEYGVVTVEGKVALPVRVLAKVFNLDVAYDAETQSVLLNRRDGERAYLEDGETYYEEDTLYWLSRIIHAESGNQCLEGKLAVGNVVMNRVADPAFPDNIYDVLFQKNQFSPASSGSIYRQPGDESVVAAKLVLDGAEVLDDALFFNRAGMNTRAARTRPYVATIGAHSFYA